MEFVAASSQRASTCKFIAVLQEFLTGFRVILGAFAARYAISTGAFEVKGAGVICRMGVVMGMIAIRGMKIVILSRDAISSSRGSGWRFMGLGSVGSVGSE